MPVAPPLLSASTLASARAGTQRPTYDRDRLRTGIVHLGLGTFVRAYQALYTEDMLAEPGDWGMIGVSLQRPRPARPPHAAGRPLYCPTTGSLGAVGPLVGCLRSVLVAPEDPVTVVEAMAGLDMRVVSLTVIEKGYCIDPATGRLQQHHPGIRHDLEHPGEPRTAVGFILAALERRRDSGMAPFTVLSCDNLPANGRLPASLVSDFAALRDCGFATWVERYTAFPAPMVDQIVPATTPEDLAEATHLTGLTDAAAVVHERYRQWVIEDRFIEDARPSWERVGAEIVGDVAPYEHMKLRLLNGAHSALAYLGYLAGRETIADTVADPVLRDLVEKLWREIIPVVPAPPGTDLSSYTRVLLERFSNPAIRHRTWQVAMDGSQKLPQRLLATIRERLARDLSIQCLALAVAGWVRYAGGVDEHGWEIDVRDPLAAETRSALDNAGGDPWARVRAVLGMEEVFATDLARDQRFENALVTAYNSLLAGGAHCAAAELNPYAGA